MDLIYKVAQPSCSIVNVILNYIPTGPFIRYAFIVPGWTPFSFRAASIQQRAGNMTHYFFMLTQQHHTVDADFLLAHSL